MELKLDAKLMKAVNGLMLFAISLILMAANIEKLGDIHWLIGLFLMFGACSLCTAWFYDGKKDMALALRACFYFLFAIVFFAKKEIVMDAHFFLLWGMIEAALVVYAGLQEKEAKGSYWYVNAGFGALALFLAFIGCFVAKNGAEILADAIQNAFASAFSGGGDSSIPHLSLLVGLPLMIVALANIFPFCENFLPKIEIKK